MRKTALVNNECYHIYNRGTDKRKIFSDEIDVNRFLESLIEFNNKEPIGSIYENSFRKKTAEALGRPTSKLVEIIAYCLNPNHYHLILKQQTKGGISEFMKRLGGGYTKYFNEKYKRSGVLFQGKFKSVHINSDRQLLYVSAYVNLNNRVHQLGRRTSKLVRSSWGEYIKENKNEMCTTDIVLGQFRGPKDYKKFAKETLEIIQKGRGDEEFKKGLIE